MYKDLKVTQGEVASNNVKSAPDRLRGTATENKNIFDKLVELFVAKYNALLDQLDDNAYIAIDPITIEGYTISHADSGITQGKYGSDEGQYPQEGGTFIVPYFITDSHGHLVSAGERTVTLPAGGGGGTDNYNDLSNKPSINSVTLSGDKSASDLSLASASHSHTKSDISDFPSLATVATTGDYDDLSDKPSIPTKTSDLTNDSGFITGYTETDPVFSASAAHNISSTDISNWNGKSTVSLNRKTTSGTNIADITINGTTTQLYAPTSGGGGGSGTVTSVGITNGGGLSISGSPVTSSGNITVGHSNSVPAGTASSTTSHTEGPSVNIPYVNYDDNGHIESWGERSHTVTGFFSKEDILSVFYPVGSYYETSDTTFDPNTAWGGTWVLEAAGKFHVSAGTGYAAGSTGGSADAIVPSHKHSVSKVTDAITGGAHAHDIANRSVYSGGSNYIALFKGGTGTSTNAALSETHTHDLPAHETDSTGTSGTGANMPPYIAVNRWHRTA